jgi:hypothetical protein
MLDWNDYSAQSDEASTVCTPTDAPTLLHCAEKRINYFRIPML